MLTASGVTSGKSRSLGLRSSGVMDASTFWAKPFRWIYFGSSFLDVGSSMRGPSMYFHLQPSNSLRRIPVAVSKAKIGFMGSGEAASTRRNCSGLRCWVRSSCTLGAVTSKHGFAALRSVRFGLPGGLSAPGVGLQPASQRSQLATFSLGIAIRMGIQILE